MLRRRPLLFGLLCVIAVGLAYYLAWEPRVTFADRFYHLRRGQTLAEVNQVMGRPPGSYSKQIYFLPRDIVIGMLNHHGVYEHWVGADCLVVVQFDENGKAWQKWIIYPPKEGDSPLSPDSWRSW